MKRYLEPIAIIALGIAVAVVGDPRPLGLIVGGIGGATGAFILFKETTR